MKPWALLLFLTLFLLSATIAPFGFKEASAQGPPPEGASIGLESRYLVRDGDNRYVDNVLVFHLYLEDPDLNWSWEVVRDDVVVETFQVTGWHSIGEVSLGVEYASNLTVRVNGSWVWSWTSISVLNQQSYGQPAKTEELFISKPPWEWDAEQWGQFFAVMTAFIAGVTWSGHMAARFIARKGGAIEVVRERSTVGRQPRGRREVV